MALQLLYRTNCQYVIPLNAIMPTGSGAATERSAANQFNINMPTNNITYRLGVWLNSAFPYPPLNNVTSPALIGFLLRKLVYWMSIGTENLQSHSITLAREAFLGNASRAASTSLGGTLTYTVDGTVTTLPVTQRANPYLIEVNLPSPYQFVNPYEQATAELVLQTGATNGTAKLHGMAMIGDFGIYA